MLTHRDDTYYWGESGRIRPASKWWDEGAGPRYGRPERAARSQVQFDPGNVCNYCGGRGHWKDECPVKSSGKSVHAKPVALAASVRKINLLSSQCVISPCVKPCVASPCEQVEADVGSDVDCGLDESDFSDFVSEGHVSLVGQ